uniref:Peptidase S54 rhomboid domain-containing protein n=1 Tax=viral metagenome TaxID=1070528 RepID=A0A6C0C6S5_9ZZZZ
MNMYETGSEIINYQLRSFYHANLQHLAANAISFYGLSFIEDVIGTSRFIVCIVFLWIVSSTLLYIYHEMFSSRKILTVGFSAVIFGLFVVYFSLMHESPSMTVAKLVISILPQMIIPGVSFEGHIFGVIAGFLYVTLFPVG